MQTLLESLGVQPAIRKSIGQFMEEVVRGLRGLEADMVTMANVPGAPEAVLTKEPPLVDSMAHGHLTLESLFQEIRQDENARTQDHER